MFRALVVITLCALAAPIVVVAGQQRADDPIRELLAEVKLLRVALKRSASVTPRVQVLVARMQLQEQRIAEVSRRLDAVHSEQRDVARALEAMGQQVATLEDERRTESNDSPRGRMIEHDLVALRSQIESLERRRQDLTNEDSVLTAQSAQEQNRWAELNGRLDQLERSLGRP